MLHPGDAARLAVGESSVTFADTPSPSLMKTPAEKGEEVAAE